MQTRSIRDDDELRALATLAAGLQQQPESHVIYLGLEADGIFAELGEMTWRQVSAVAVDGDTVLGWLIGDVDSDRGRVWWIGPFIVAEEWEPVASALFDAGRRHLADNANEEEMAVDARFERCRTWGASQGFVEEEGAYVLQLEGGVELGAAAVREITEADREVVARIHDELFPGTHTTGREIACSHDDTHRRLVTEVDGEVVGYIAVERQADGSGYIDYLGVIPTARRRGLGGDLVRAGVAELQRLDVTSIGLTVRVGSEGARELYRSLGFREERTAVPLRLGFSLS